MPTPVEVQGLPFPLEPSPGEVRWALDPDTGAASATAAPRTDVFVDPGTGSATLNAATLLGGPPAGDFRFSARVTVDFAATFDAGVLLLWLDERNWAKLCFELSPDGEPMVVSVVCRGVADDANAFVVSGRSVRLRITRTGQAFAFHASTDGTRWRLVRHFALDTDAAAVRLGFEVQSPTGDGCAVRFDDVRFVPEGLAELRDGS
jgi:regulation of enolase protein 1 (concanavalin A-like superfamily)